MPERVVAVRGDGRLVVLSAVDGRELRELASNWGPGIIAVDPLGGTVWFTRPGGGCDAHDLLAVRVAGGAPERVTDGFSPALSADLAHLAFVRGRGHGPLGPCDREVVVRELDDGDERTWAVPDDLTVELVVWADDRLVVSTRPEGDDSVEGIDHILLDTTEDDAFADAPPALSSAPDAVVIGGLGQSGEVAALVDDVPPLDEDDKEVVRRVPPGPPPGQRLAALDPVTGEEQRTLYAFPPSQRYDDADFLPRPSADDRRFTSDRSGRHLLWFSFGGGESLLFRYSAGDPSPTLLARDVSQAGWLE